VSAIFSVVTALSANFAVVTAPTTILEELTELSVTFEFPAGPAGPIGPVGPCLPTLPAGPALPVGPCKPLSPRSPPNPLGPVGPVGPVLFSEFIVIFMVIIFDNKKNIIKKNIDFIVYNFI
jgi:hypothetical protein